MTTCEQDQNGTVPSWSCSQTVSKTVWHIPLLCVQWKTPDDRHRNCPKHVEFYSKNRFEESVHPLLCVQWKTPDDRHRNCPKHVEFYSTNRFEESLHPVGFIIRMPFSWVAVFIIRGLRDYATLFLYCVMNHTISGVGLLVKMRVSILSIIFVWNISHSKEKSARYVYCRKCE